MQVMTLINVAKQDEDDNAIRWLQFAVPKCSRYIEEDNMKKRFSDKRLGDSVAEKYKNKYFVKN